MCPAHAPRHVSRVSSVYCGDGWLPSAFKHLHYIRKDNGLLELRAKQHFHMAKGAGRLLFGPSGSKLVEDPYDTVEEVRANPVGSYCVCMIGIL